MFRASNFDKLLDKATSNLRLDPDWPSILQICDLIRQNDCSPKYAVTAVKKKLYSQNPHQAMFALLTLESIVKNCGSGIHDEVASKQFCEMLRDLVKSTQHENLRTKILELIQAWGFAFRNTPKYRSVQDTVNILKAEGYKFPTLKESDAMFSADTAPEWADGEVCHRCRVVFTLVVRRHHCRACGQVFCQQCSSKTSTLPKFGIEKEVRVCDACYDKVSRPPSSSAKLEVVESTNDYASTPQKRPGKTAEELQEEEELQLALALSQSEAEHKEKEKRTRPSLTANPVQLHPSVSPTPSSVSASPEHGAANAELSRYLDRGYWEQRVSHDAASAPAPTASAPQSSAASSVDYGKPANSKMSDDDAEDKEIDEFINTLKSQLEIFVNRMKSNSSRGRSIANDTSVQTLFMNITAMHSRLLRYIQQQDDKRVYLESLQDKLAQIRDSRAALDTLRAEHAARLAAAAEAAERQKQLQMATKLEAMRKKKHEYLQYQRQLALQRVQEQEREMQMRQEQQKHQYMMSAGAGYYLPGVSMHQYQPAFNQPIYANSQFHQGMPQPVDGAIGMPGQPPVSQPNMPIGMSGVSQPTPQVSQPFPLSMPSGMTLSQANNMMATQSSMAHPNIRAQMGVPTQMLLQQMHQLRLQSQQAHQMLPQNMENGLNNPNHPQQNGQQQQPKQNLPNQPQQIPNSMMPQMSVAQPQLNMGMQMPPNVRPTMIPTSQPGSGAVYTMPQQIQATIAMQNQMHLPNQPMSLPSQQILQGQNLAAQNHVNLNNQHNQVSHLPQSQQIPHSQPMSLPNQSIPGPHPGMPAHLGQMTHQMMNQQGIHMQNQMQPPGSQGQQFPPQGQHPSTQAQSANQQQNQLPMMQNQQVPHSMVQNHPGQQIPQNHPNQQIPQNNPNQQIQPNHQNQQIQQNHPNQQIPQNHPGQPMPQGQPMQGPPQQNQQLPQAHHMQQGPAMMQGQPIIQGQQIRQVQQMPPGQTMMQGQVINQAGQATNNPQTIPQQQPQNTTGQPVKMLQASQQTQMVQTPVKTENNNNTAELISFD